MTQTTYTMLAVAAITIAMTRAQPGFDVCSRTWNLPCTNCRGLPIPDNRIGSSRGPVDKIFFDASEIPHFCVVQDIDIIMDIRHTWSRDMHFTLTSPNNMTRNLGRACYTTNDNYKVILDDSGQSSCNLSSPPFHRVQTNGAPFSEFASKDASGLWELDLYDEAAGDVGHINDVTISIRTTEPNLCSQLTCSHDCNACGLLEWYVTATVELFARRQVPPVLLRGRSRRGNPSEHRSRSGLRQRMNRGNIKQFESAHKTAARDPKQSFEDYLASLKWNSGENFTDYPTKDEIDSKRGRRSDDGCYEGSGSGSGSGSGDAWGACRAWVGNCIKVIHNIEAAEERGSFNIPPASAYVNQARFPENRGQPEPGEGSGSGSGEWNPNGGSGEGYKMGLGYGSSFDFGYGSGSAGSGNLNLAAHGTGGNVPYDFFVRVLTSIFPEPFSLSICGWNTDRNKCRFGAVDGDQTTRAEAEHLYETRPFACERYYTESPTTQVSDDSGDGSGDDFGDGSGPDSRLTQAPTLPPSSMPSSLPTSYPTQLPTAYPSSLPTSYPTQLPTAYPSSLPTSSPTSTDPTPQPTLHPTTTTSNIPTIGCNDDPAYSQFCAYYESIGACRWSFVKQKCPLSCYICTTQ